MKFKKYRRKQIAELRPWRVGEDMSRISGATPKTTTINGW
jgi:hypothetical protein